MCDEPLIYNHRELVYKNIYVLINNKNTKTQKHNKTIKQ